MKRQAQIGTYFQSLNFLKSFISEVGNDIQNYEESIWFIKTWVKHPQTLHKIRYMESK